MTTPIPDPAQATPDAVIAEAPVTVTFEAIQAAIAEIKQAEADARSGLWSRVLRTLTQGIAGAAVTAVVYTVYEATNQGTTDPKTIGLLAGQALFTAVSAYVHNKVQPANQ